MWKVIDNYGSKKLFVSLPNKEKSKMNRYQQFNVMVDIYNNVIKSLGKISFQESTTDLKFLQLPSSACIDPANWFMPSC